MFDARSKVWAVVAGAMVAFLSSSGFSEASAASAHRASSQSDKTLQIVYFDSAGATSDPTGAWLHQVAAQFEHQNPGVTVQLEKIVASESDYYTKLDLLQSSDATAPDIVQEDTFMIGSDSSGGYLLPLTSLVKKWREWSTFFPSMKLITTYNRQVWGVPYRTGDGYLWYNKQLFKKAGIPVPWHPKNWAAILQAAQKIKQKLPGVIPLNVYSGMPTGENASLWGFQMLLYGTGNNLYDYHSKKWVVESPGFLHSLEFIQKVYSNGLSPSLSEALTTTIGTLVGTRLIPQGQLAIDLDGNFLASNWVAGTSSAWPAWKKVMGYTPLPTEFGQTPGYDTASGGWALSVSKRSKNPALAWKFIQLACNPQNIASAVSTTTGLSTTQVSAKGSAYESSPNVRFSTKLLEHTHFRPAFSDYPRVSYAIETAMEEVMTGQLTPAQAMVKYAQTVEGIVGKGHVEILNRAETKQQLQP